MKWGNVKEYNEWFNPSMMVYYVSPTGATGCLCDVKQFNDQNLEKKYKGYLLIIAPPDAPVYFRSV